MSEICLTISSLKLWLMVVKVFSKSAENYSPEIECGVDDSHLKADSNLPVKKRISYSKGGGTGKKAKLTIAHRLIVLCTVP